MPSEKTPTRPSVGRMLDVVGISAGAGSKSTATAVAVAVSRSASLMSVAISPPISKTIRSKNHRGDEYQYLSHFEYIQLLLHRLLLNVPEQPAQYSVVGHGQQSRMDSR